MFEESDVNITRVYIGLGTNIGNRIKHLVDARQLLKNLALTQTLRYSSLYESSPVGYTEQADFINCAIELDCSADKNVLFAEMQTIETNLGRVRDSKNQNAPRIIDLDLLLFGTVQSKNKKLIIPHPKIIRRLFVLKPLLELKPNLFIPNLGDVTELIKLGYAKHYYDGQSIRRLSMDESASWGLE